MKPIKSLYIARLFFNKSLIQYHDSLFYMLHRLASSRAVVSWHMGDTDGLAVDMARNMHVQNAISMDADAIVWLDTDMIYPDDSLVRLVEMSNAGHMIAGGLYRRAVPPHDLLTEMAWGISATLDELRANVDGGTTRVAMTAGGFTIVRSEVYLAIFKHWQQRGIDMPWYCNWDFHGGRNGCGEDRFFVTRAGELGITPVVDPELHAIHAPYRSVRVPVEGEATTL